MKFPFDPSIKHHLLIALGLAVWIFVFLYFTKPLDVNEFTSTEKLIYLPLYGLLGALCYTCMLPFQNWFFKRQEKQWSLTSELLFFGLFILFAFLVMRGFYLYVIVYGQPNPYSLQYYLTGIFFPAILVIIPIIFIGRFAFGKYKEKQLEEQKIEIKGDGNYEGLRLLFSDLIMLEASDNYVEIHFQDNGNYKKQLVRNRLSALESTHKNLLRTHRSFLINPEHFISYKTDKSKLGLALSHNLFVPVSKTCATAVKTALNFTTD
ncbi:LytTR family transcriptional regulator [Dokdonia sinensis]|uniref:LytTR family transcriptional regulator n=1 Tax=Dokdonia sinensis TaxID=2479847 RepID=A0A3M0G513_9FLAO|nr:LytTR family DNA-binding domain-containing protein [Dokdonia sinensis]RMB57332.1 LytTR family transcriptional regulator [Dokdonia sinensis]